VNAKTKKLIQALQDAVFRSPGATSAALRTSVADRAAAPSGKERQVPESLRAYVDKVAHAPYKVIDEDIDALREAGHDDDAIFELTIAAAVGAGLERGRRGMAALKGEAS